MKIAYKIRNYVTFCTSCQISGGGHTCSTSCQIWGGGGGDVLYIMSNIGGMGGEGGVLYVMSNFPSILSNCILYFGTFA